MSNLFQRFVWGVGIGLSVVMIGCGGSTDMPASDLNNLVITAPSSDEVPAPNNYELPEGMDEQGNRPGFKPATVCENNSCPEEEDVETDADRAASSIPYSLFTRGQK